MEETLPRFYRYMFSGFETKLRLPNLVSKKVVKQKLEQVVLTSQNGGCWVVKIHESSDGKIWLTKGWDDFVLQNDIRLGDFAVFEHTGRSGSLCFNVMLFDGTCCERGFHDRRGRTQGNPSVNIGHTNVFPSQEHIDPVKVEVDLDEVPPPVKGKAKSVGGRPQGNPSQANIPEHINSEKVEVDLDEVPPPVKIQKHKSAHDKGKGNAKRKHPNVANVSSKKQRRMFVTTIKHYNIRSRSPFMHIPAKFCQANGLYHNARINLKGPSVEHQVSLTVCNGGKTRYAVITRGWPEFISGNNLKKGDTCVFKLHRAGTSSNAVVFDVEVLNLPN